MSFKRNKEKDRQIALEASKFTELLDKLYGKDKDDPAYREYRNELLSSVLVIAGIGPEDVQSIFDKCMITVAANSNEGTDGVPACRKAADFEKDMKNMRETSRPFVLTSVKDKDGRGDMIHFSADSPLQAADVCIRFALDIMMNIQQLYEIDDMQRDAYVISIAGYMEETLKHLCPPAPIGGYPDHKEDTDNNKHINAGS